MITFDVLFSEGGAQDVISSIKRVRKELKESNAQLLEKIKLEKAAGQMEMSTYNQAARLLKQHTEFTEKLEKAIWAKNEALLESIYAEVHARDTMQASKKKLQEYTEALTKATQARSQALKAVNLFKKANDEASLGTTKYQQQLGQLSAVHKAAAAEVRSLAKTIKLEETVLKDARREQRASKKSIKELTAANKAETDAMLHAGAETEITRVHLKGLVDTMDKAIDKATEMTADEKRLNAELSRQHAITKQLGIAHDQLARRGFHKEATAVMEEKKRIEGVGFAATGVIEGVLSKKVIQDKELWDPTSPRYMFAPEKIAAYSGELDKAEKSMNKYNKTLRQGGGFLNTWFGTFSIIMSGIAASIFVMQNVIRFFRAIVTPLLDLEEGFIQIKSSVGATAEELRGYEDAAERAAKSGLGSVKGNIEKLLAMRKAGLDASEAIAVLNLEQAKLASANQGTLSAAFSRFKTAITDLAQEFTKFISGPLMTALNMISSIVEWLAEGLEKSNDAAASRTITPEALATGDFDWSGTYTGARAPELTAEAAAQAAAEAAKAAAAVIDFRTNLEKLSHEDQTALLNKLDGIVSIDKIVDGDTIKVKIEGSPFPDTQVGIRAAGYNTPESVASKDYRIPNSVLGKVAAAVMKDIVQQTGDGEMIATRRAGQSGEAEWDKHSRLLRDFFTMTGVHLGKLLDTLGLAENYGQYYEGMDASHFKMKPISMDIIAPFAVEDFKIQMNEIEKYAAEHQIDITKIADEKDPVKKAQQQQIIDAQKAHYIELAKLAGAFGYDAQMQAEAKALQNLTTKFATHNTVLEETGLMMSDYGYMMDVIGKKEDEALKKAGISQQARDKIKMFDQMDKQHKEYIATVSGLSQREVDIHKQAFELSGEISNEYWVHRVAETKNKADEILRLTGDFIAAEIEQVNGEIGRLQDEMTIGEMIFNITGETSQEYLRQLDEMMNLTQRNIALKTGDIKATLLQGFKDKADTLAKEYKLETDMYNDLGVRNDRYFEGQLKNIDNLANIHRTKYGAMFDEEKFRLDEMRRIHREQLDAWNKDLLDFQEEVGVTTEEGYAFQLQIADQYFADLRIKYQHNEKRLKELSKAQHAGEMTNFIARNQEAVTAYEEVYQALGVMTEQYKEYLRILLVLNAEKMLDLGLSEEVVARMIKFTEAVNKLKEVAGGTDIGEGLIAGLTELGKTEFFGQMGIDAGTEFREGMESATRDMFESLLRKGLDFSEGMQEIWDQLGEAVSETAMQMALDMAVAYAKQAADAIVAATVAKAVNASAAKETQIAWTSAMASIGWGVAAVAAGFVMSKVMGGGNKGPSSMDKLKDAIENLRDSIEGLSDSMAKQQYTRAGSSYSGEFYDAYKDLHDIETEIYKIKQKFIKEANSTEAGFYFSHDILKSKHITLYNEGILEPTIKVWKNFGDTIYGIALDLFESIQAFDERYGGDVSMTSYDKAMDELKTSYADQVKAIKELFAAEDEYIARINKMKDELAYWKSLSPEDLVNKEDFYRKGGKEGSGRPYFDEAEYNKALEKAGIGIDETIKTISGGIRELEALLMDPAKKTMLQDFLGDQFIYVQNLIEEFRAKRAETLQSAKDFVQNLEGASGNLQLEITKLNKTFSDWMISIIDNGGSIKEQASLIVKWTKAVKLTLLQPFKTLKENVAQAISDITQSSWGAEEYQTEYNKLRADFNKLNKSSDSYYDDSLILLEKQFDTLQKIQQLTEQEINELTGVLKTVQDLIFNISGGGDLAPITSREFWQSSYDKAWAAASAEDATSEDIDHFTSIATDYLNFMKAYGNDANYKNVSADVLADLLVIEDKIQGRLGELELIAITNEELGNIYKLLDTDIDRVISVINALPEPTYQQLIGGDGKTLSDIYTSLEDFPTDFETLMKPWIEQIAAARDIAIVNNTIIPNPSTVPVTADTYSFNPADWPENWFDNIIPWDSLKLFQHGGWTGDEPGLVHPNEYVVPTTQPGRDHFLSSLGLSASTLAAEIVSNMSHGPGRQGAGYPAQITLQIGRHQLANVMIEEINSNKEVRKALKRVN